MNHSPGREHILITDILSVLSELSRLRLLRLLEQEELAVGEMAAIVQMPQSTVSRHLKVLLESGWIQRRSERTTARYHMTLASLPDSWQELWLITKKQLAQPPQIIQDDHRLKEVLSERNLDTHSYFGQVGGDWSCIRTELFGNSFADDALLGLLTCDWIVADMGCGTGEISARIAPHVEKILAVDQSNAMLKAAKTRLSKFNNIEFVSATLSDLPLDDSSINAAVISLVLHHIDNPPEIIQEAARCLKPNGLILIIDMLEHNRNEYKHTMGHHWLGFNPNELKNWLIKAGLGKFRYWRLPSDPEAKGPELFAAKACKC